MKRFSFFAAAGVGWILSATLLTGILWAQFGTYAASPTAVLTLALMCFYYDPDRELPSHPLGVMSPVDGTVVSVELFYDPFLNRTSRRIRVQPDLLGAYHGRSPTEGKIMAYWPALADRKQEYSQPNTKGAWWIKTDEGDDVILAITAGLASARARFDVQVGERVGQARRCGRFPHSSTVDILVGENSFIEVEPEQHVVAGVDKLATFNHDLDQPPDRAII